MNGTLVKARKLTIEYVESSLVQDKCIFVLFPAKIHALVLSWQSLGITDSRNRKILTRQWRRNLVVSIEMGDDRG